MEEYIKLLELMAKDTKEMIEKIEEATSILERQNIRTQKYLENYVDSQEYGDSK